MVARGQSFALYLSLKKGAMTISPFPCSSGVTARYRG
jgi:hypothetical protein